MWKYPQGECKKSPSSSREETQGEKKNRRKIDKIFFFFLMFVFFFSFCLLRLISNANSLSLLLLRYIFMELWGTFFGINIFICSAAAANNESYFCVYTAAKNTTREKGEKKKISAHFSHRLRENWMTCDDIFVCVFFFSLE